MRTTIDLPDNLFRRAKCVALERGATLKEFLTQAVTHELEYGRREGGRGRLPLPAVRLPDTTPILQLTPEEIAESDSDQELMKYHEFPH